MSLLHYFILQNLGQVTLITLELKLYQKNHLPKKQVIKQYK